MWHSKSVKKECFNEENFQGSLQRESCMDGQTSSTTRNTGVGWKETGDDGRAGNP